MEPAPETNHAHIVTLFHGNCPLANVNDVQLFREARYNCTSGKIGSITSGTCETAEQLTVKAETTCRNDTSSNAAPSPISPNQTKFTREPNKPVSVGALPERICLNKEKNYCYEKVCNNSGTGTILKYYQGWWSCFYCKKV